MFCGDVSELAGVVRGIDGGAWRSYVGHPAIPDMESAGLVCVDGDGSVLLTDSGDALAGLLRLSDDDRRVVLSVVSMLEKQVDVAGIHGCDEVA